MTFDMSEAHGTGIENESDQPVEIKLWEYDEAESKMISSYLSVDENQ